MDSTNQRHLRSQSVNDETHASSVDMEAVHSHQDLRSPDFSDAKTELSEDETPRPAMTRSRMQGRKSDKGNNTVFNLMMNTRKNSVTAKDLYDPIKNTMGRVAALEKTNSKILNKLEELIQTFDTVTTAQPTTSTTTTTTTTAATTATVSQRPYHSHKIEYFYGKPNESWQNWARLFELITKGQNLDNERMAHELSTHLRGNALNYYFQLSEEERKDYETVIKHLGKKCDTTEAANLARAKLKNFKQPFDLPIADFSEKFAQMAELAFRDLPVASREKLALEYYLDNVNDYIRIALLSSQPKTLTDAIEKSNWLDAYIPKQQTINAVRIDESKNRSYSYDRNNQQVPQNKTKTKDEEIQELREEIQKLKRGQRSSSPYPYNTQNNRNRSQSPYARNERENNERGRSPLRPGSTRDRFNRSNSRERSNQMICYKCNNRGHMAKNCYSRNQINVIQDIAEALQSVQLQNNRQQQNIMMPQWNQQQSVMPQQLTTPQQQQYPQNYQQNFQQQNLTNNAELDALRAANEMMRLATQDYNSTNSFNMIQEQDFFEAPKDHKSNFKEQEFKRKMQVKGNIKFWGCTLIMFSWLLRAQQSTNASQVPLICDMGQAPSIWKQPKEIDCEHFTTNKTEIVKNATIMIMKENIKAQEIVAYKCMLVIKETKTYSPFHLFRRQFTDMKNRTFLGNVEEWECQEAVEEKQTKYGKVHLQGNKMMTMNEQEAYFQDPWNVKNIFGADWISFYSYNFIIQITSIILHPNSGTFVSAAGDISGCNLYGSRFCHLKDGILFHGDPIKHQCTLEEYRAMKGQMSEKFFISRENTVAISFDREKNFKTDCNKTYFYADQGFYFRIIETKRTKRSLSLNNAQTQFENVIDNENAREAFTQALIQTCFNMKQLSEFVSINMKINPTIQMRRLLKDH